MVRNPILRSTTRGDLYIAMYLMDRTGQVNGRMWQATENVYNSLPQPGFVKVQGRSEVYQNKLQIVVNSICPIDADKVALEDFLARTDKDQAQMFAEVKRILSGIQNTQLKALVDEYLADEELMETFCNCPAAVKMHHDYLGGLLEHTHNMLRVTAVITPLYPGIQTDLVLAGIFLHDMGKTEELSYDMAFAYTDSGQLVGHISQSLVMLNRKADALRAKGVEISQETLDAVGHIILSHHGSYEFGSPKLPATPEAFVVTYIDNLDAKVNQVMSAIENEPGDADWTVWKGPLQTRLYRKRLEE